MSRFLFYITISVFMLSLSSCKKKSEPIDPLSYLVLQEKMGKSRVIEHSRTQVVSIDPTANKQGIISLTLAFAMDSKIPKGASTSPRNAYVIRFTLQDSLFRSKRMGGGTFVLKFQKNSKGYSIRNFQKSKGKALVVRYPAFMVNSMDTIVNPNIVDILDTPTKRSILRGSNGTLTPIKPRTYMITILFHEIAGDEWAVDHGYPDESPDTKEPTVVFNSTSIGLKIDFPFKERKATLPDYELDKLGKI